MDLEFKTDFEGTRSFWNLFWKGDAKRPAISAVVAKPGKTPVPLPGFGVVMTESPEAVVEQALCYAESHEFLGDAVPFFTLSVCSNLLAALLGAEVKVERNKSGIDTKIIPFLDDIGDTNIRFRRDGLIWEKMLELISVARRKCDGKLIVGAPTLTGNLDILGAVRGTERLMMDFYDAPDAVHNALSQVTDAYIEVMEEFANLFEFRKYGSVTRHGLYSSGATNVPQCDFGYNIGREHFNEFALPYLKREIDVLDSVEYHLDGINSINHLESICSIEKVDLIQWVPGAGHGDENWDELYGKIDLLGKGQLRYASPGTVRDLWKQYKSPKLYCLLPENAGSAEVYNLMDSFR